MSAELHAVTCKRDEVERKRYGMGRGAAAQMYAAIGRRGVAETAHGTGRGTLHFQ